MTSIAPIRTPEEEELARKQAELDQLESELAERELHLATARGELGAFERRYIKTIGVLYVELDQINAQIAERLSNNSGTAEAKHLAEQARRRADESYSAICFEINEAKDFRPSQELKSLYRQVAKRLHPDLASEPADRIRREQLMAKANQAYENEETTLLREILQEYESSPESVHGSGVAADLVRVIRKIKQVRIRVSQIEQELQNLLKSDMAKLKTRAEELEQRGRDFLNELADGVRERLGASRLRLEATLK
jgi:DnaJ-domain-containing protein 1